MSTLHNLQKDFLAYVQGDSTSAIVSCIESSPKRSAEQRMMLYENAYRLRLKEALSTDYGCLHGYLGDELFDTLVEHYIDAYPSHHPSLRYFSQYMETLVTQLAPFNEFEEIVELVQIEKAFANSFDAADCTSVSIDQLAQLAPSAWGELTLVFHDAVQLLPQKYNSFKMWQALTEEQTPPQKESSEMTWLIWRDNLVSRYRGLAPSELAALTCAMSSGSFADVCEAMLGHYSDDEVPLKAVGYLQRWVNDQMVCEFN